VIHIFIRFKFPLDSTAGYHLDVIGGNTFEEVGILQVGYRHIVID
jgi:hypothetical protein